MTDTGSQKKENKTIFFAGREIIDPNSPTVKVDGLVPSTKQTPTAESFGESGDVFNHLPWRGLFAILWTMQVSRFCLLGLINTFLLRSKSVKVLDKGCANLYSISLPAIGSEERSTYDKVYNPADVSCPITVNIATETSKVPANALTIERLKCVLRIFAVPNLMKAGRLSASCESTGYADIFRGLVKYANWRQEKIVNKAAEGDDDVAFWRTIKESNISETVNKAINAMACASGSISTKEVYQEDESEISGTIWWCGVNAMMIDACNKMKASKEIESKRSRLENSCFYSDFKRKMIARNIREVQGKPFLEFLSVMARPMSRHLKAGSLMSVEESGILDLVMREASSSSAILAQGTEGESGMITLTGSTADQVAKSLLTQLNELKVTSPKRTDAGQTSR